jgi:hypothetical protein
MSFSVIDPGHELWRSTFDALPRFLQDVFYTPEFASLIQKTIASKYEVLAACYFDSNNAFLYPFIKRPLDKVTGISELSNLFDITGIYGRGGLLSTSDPYSDSAIFFRYMLNKYLSSEKVVCAFERYHPVMKNENLFQDDREIIDVGGFIVVPLEPEYSNIESSFKHSVRKDIKKAERNSIKCFSEATTEHVEDFYKIYYETMDRNNAEKFYYFDHNFFTGLRKLLPNNYRFFYAIKDGCVVSTELVLYHGDYCHSFLGGTQKEHLHLSANPRLKQQIIIEMKSLGCKYFLLGGGLRPDDGIYNFKKAYAPNGICPSKIGGKVFDSDGYENIKKYMMRYQKEIKPGRIQFYD